MDFKGVLLGGLLYVLCPNTAANELAQPVVLLRQRQRMVEPKSNIVVLLRILNSDTLSRLMPVGGLCTMY